MTASQLDAYREAIETVARVQAEREELSAKIDAMTRVDIPAAELAAGAARDAHKSVAASSALGEAQDADVRLARSVRDDAQDKLDALVGAVEQLRKREAATHLREREARTARAQLAEQLTGRILSRDREALVTWLAPTMASTLRRICQLTELSGQGFPTGESFLRLSGDLQPIFRALGLEFTPSGIYPTLSAGRDELRHADFLAMLEAEAEALA